MSDSQDHDEAGQDPLTEAAEWFAILTDEQVTQADRERWQAWLDASPAHRDAWARVEQLDAQFREVAGTPAKQALESAGTDRRRFLKGLAGLAVAAPGGWLIWKGLPTAQWTADYRTATGAIRDVRLPDGSRLWLNTDSAVNRRYTDSERRLTLIAGEIALETAVDSRPLVVDTPAGAVRPVGTRFGVRLTENGARVIVHEGRVTLHPRQEKSAGTAVEPSQARRFDAETAYPARAVDRDETAWTRGMLIADGMPLDAFLDELARYRTGVIRYGPEAGELRLVGAYPLDDTDRVLAALEDSLPVTVSRLTPWWITVEVHGQR
jgi:transmembrane sensor